MGKPLGPTGEFFRRRDEWRKHPMLTNQFRHATPGLGIALVAFGVYLDDVTILPHNLQFSNRRDLGICVGVDYTLTCKELCCVARFLGAKDSESTEADESSIDIIDVPEVPELEFAVPRRLLLLPGDLLLRSVNKVLWTYARKGRMTTLRKRMPLLRVVLEHALVGGEGGGGRKGKERVVYVAVNDKSFGSLFQFPVSISAFNKASTLCDFLSWLFGFHDM
ncbi:hypothetical protein RJ639_035230 [Escallonia herrerae]|uniref:Uncharacterized protein n=1 Tax=Escallonia herrerae TaxID=1293975 RepID=A0AA88WRE7_9ASTE|nr:hypothetical protein RJ639_035230 [Escallonia herrerae]